MICKHPPRLPGRKAPTSHTFPSHLLPTLSPSPQRYTTPKNEQINVMYRNIRHAFFQPAENEMVTILHFHLINPIMLGNKKTKDVQVCVGV
jgi:nucleosome binding factor SPN SPT16 subunit